jgi:hypothetical protein
MDWSELFPIIKTQQSLDNDQCCIQQVEFADVGCGYGGLLGKCSVYWCVLLTAMFILPSINDIATSS